MSDTDSVVKPALYFDANRHACIRLRDIGNKTVFLGISDSKVKGKRAVDVHQLPTDKFNNTYKLEVNTTSLKGITEKWMGLSSLGVIITPAARHAVADILNQETQDMATAKTAPAKTEVTKKTTKKTDTPIADAAKATAAETKKSSLPGVTPGPTAQADAEKAAKATEVIKKNQEADKAKKPTVTLKHLVSTGTKKEVKVPNSELPLATAVVIAAPVNSDLKIGKTLAGEDPQPHTSTDEKETTVSTTKPATKTATAATKAAPKTTAKTMPKATVKKTVKAESAGHRTGESDRRVGVRSAELTGKKIKVNVKADLSLVREGTVRMALMKAVMACATVDEALSKKVKRQDGEKMSVNATHVKMAVEYGFITLV